VACLRVAPFLFSRFFRGLVPLARVCVWCLCGWPWGPGLFWFLLCVVAFLSFGRFLLQRGFFRLCCALCRPVLLSRLPACAFWFPACFPPFSALSPFASLCNTRATTSSYLVGKAPNPMGCITSDRLTSHIYSVLLSALLATLNIPCTRFVALMLTVSRGTVLNRWPLAPRNA
jgi:hypothetical protein